MFPEFPQPWSCYSSPLSEHPLLVSGRSPWQRDGPPELHLHCFPYYYQSLVNDSEQEVVYPCCHLVLDQRVFYRRKKMNYGSTQGSPKKFNKNTVIRTFTITYLIYHLYNM